MRIRHRRPALRHDRGARPVQGPGAGLYSAGRGFAPPGSTKPADAVFALRVTIPGAFARVARLRASLAGACGQTRGHPPPWLGRSAPFAGGSPRPRVTRASRHGASLRCRLRSPRLASASALTRHRTTLAVSPRFRPHPTAVSARRSSNGIALARASQRVASLHRCSLSLATIPRLASLNGLASGSARSRLRRTLAIPSFPDAQRTPRRLAVLRTASPRQARRSAPSPSAPVRCIFSPPTDFVSSQALCAFALNSS